MRYRALKEIFGDAADEIIIPILITAFMIFLIIAIILSFIKMKKPRCISHRLFEIIYIFAATLIIFSLYCSGLKTEAGNALVLLLGTGSILSKISEIRAAKRCTEPVTAVFITMSSPPKNGKSYPVFKYCINGEEYNEYSQQMESLTKFNYNNNYTIYIDSEHPQILITNPTRWLHNNTKFIVGGIFIVVGILLFLL